MPDIEKVPWSQLGPDFAKAWGRADPSDPQPEHMEVIGMNGSGKTYFLATVLQERVIVRDTPTVIICTKPADTTILKLGWPVTDDYHELRRKKQVIYWPNPRAIGAQRKAYQEVKIRELLEYIWHPGSNTVVAFDEIAYAESLRSPAGKAELREIIEMYWREGRSQGITVVGMKQRPQGANRHMSSETQWTVAFVPKDHADAERFAELFGPKREWLPVFDQMNPDNHEFLIRHTRSRLAYISYCDKPIPMRRKESQHANARATQNSARAP